MQRQVGAQALGWLTINLLFPKHLRRAHLHLDHVPHVIVDIHRKRFGVHERRGHRPIHGP